MRALHFVFGLAIALALARCAHAPPPLEIVSLAPAAPGLVRPERIVYTPADELLPTVSSDGRRVAYVTTESGNLDIAVKDLTTGSVVPLTVAAADDFDPSFAPKSNRILIASRREDAKGDVYVIDADGTDPKRLTTADTADRQPVFSPDEMFIYFTRAETLGEEHIAVIDLDAEITRVLSPTPGFDSAPSPDGKYLIYTAPPGVGGRRHPHLVALRLTDGATRALTLGESPAGFGRFVSTSQIVMVRFADDDDADGRVDANDRASLWSLQVSMEGLFGGDQSAIGAPVPLTAGNSDELFPWPAPPWIYFTESAGNEQNVSRIPIAGMFSAEGVPSLEDRREQWFALRAVVARQGGVAAARASLDIATIHLDAHRPDLARKEIEQVIEAGMEPEITALAQVGLITIDREEGLVQAAGERERGEVLDRAAVALGTITATTPRLEARVALERAELSAARGDRIAALATLDRLIVTHAQVADVAARALLRRTELLRVDFDPVAVTEAYGEVLRRYPAERGLGAEASRRIVDAWTASARDRGPQIELEALRRALGRIDLPPVRILARRRIVDRLRVSGAPDLVAVELAALADEAERAHDRGAAAAALGDLAVNEENRGALPEALAAWTRLRDQYDDLPGLAASARAAIIRVALVNAADAESKGQADVARRLYRAVLDNDPRQVTAHRRSLALAAAAGDAEAMRVERKAAHDARPSDPVLRYAYGLSLTYLDPPELDDALTELDEVIRQNPLLIPAYLARGWVHEMLDDGDGTDALELAFVDYGRGAKIARDAQEHALEAEALLNQGNTSWRVADRTNDAGNFYAAFRTYTTFLSLDGKFQRPETALVFWERLSRAAVWSEEWATAALAGREAIALVERLGRKSRLPQLWANLALAYTNAGEPLYAETAFERFAAASTDAGAREARLIVAERNLALSKLDRLTRTGEGDTESALADLERSRERIPRATFEPLFPGDLLQITVADATRAPFGFTAPFELDLNLGLASRLLHQNGAVARARRLDRARLAVVDQLVRDSSPLALSVVREWLGLAVADLKNGPCAVIDDACRAAFDALRERVDALVEDGRLARDIPAMMTDRARLIALAAELESSRPRVPSIDAARGDALVPDHNTLLLQALEETKPAGTSSTALILAGPAALDTAAVHARLLHAEGLRALAGLDAPAARITDLATALSALDAALPTIDAAFASFSSARDLARAVRTPLGARVEALALHGIASSRLFGARTATVASVDTASSAISAARALGADELAVKLELARAIGGGDDDALVKALEGLSASWPLPADRGLLDRAFGRGLEIAIAREDPALAFGLADRWLLARAVAGTDAAVDGAFDPADAQLIAGYRAAKAELDVARRSFSPPGIETEPDFVERLAAARDRMRAARAAMKRVNGSNGSYAVKARLFGEPALADDVQATLATYQGLMVAIDVAGDRRAFVLVSGSTTTETPFSLVTQDRSAPVPVLPGVREWVVCDDLSSEPLVLAGSAVAHVSSPTALAASNDQLRFGVKDAWVLGSSALIPGASGLTVDDLRALGRPPEPLVVRAEPRAVEASPVEERLRGRALDIYVLDQQVALDPRAPERSTIQLAPTVEPIDPVKNVLSLATGVRPANVVILTAAGGDVPAGLDLALAVRGVASTVVVPADVPRPVVARVLLALEKDRKSLGLATALERAIAAEIPAARRIRLIGAPGLDDPATAALALKKASLLKQRTLASANSGRVADLVSIGTEYVRALAIKGDPGAAMVGGYALLLVGFQRSQQWLRAVDAQRELVAYLQNKASPEIQKKSLVAARLDLALYLSRARDVAASNAVIDDLLHSLDESGDKKSQAIVHIQSGEAARLRLDFANAARAFERAVAVYESIGAFKEKEVSPEAQDLLKRLGILYLNQLSDSARARVVFLRALEYANKPDVRTARLIDLARVARRRGEFEEAAQRAEAAREAARLMKNTDLGLDALTEATNIAWYRGDLARGRALCNEGLSQADAQLRAARVNRLGNSRAAQNRMIYVLSACGLVDMSSGDFAGAERTLLSAVRLARAGGEPQEPEVAAQYNNLGRVYLEYGHLDQAVEAFKIAAEIDERRNDRFGLAYDLRNLGTAQAAQGRVKEAATTLERALALAIEAQDDNNQLRALLVLGDLARSASQHEEAMKRYRTALEIAERTDNLDLGSQIHRAMGLIHEVRGDLVTARRELEAAIASARRLPGRAGATEFGPHRYAAFDDLIRLEIMGGDLDRAFRVAEEARTQTQLSVLDDERVSRARPALARDLGAIRAATTATKTAEIAARIAAEAPAVASRLAIAQPAAITARVPDDAAIVVYRPTDEGLVVFTLVDHTLTATVVDVSAATLGASLRDYRRRLDRRADVTTVQADLGHWLIDPIAARIANKRRLAIVAHGGVRAVAFPALPLGDGMVVDRLAVIYAPDPASAVASLGAGPLSLAGRPILALAAAQADDGTDAPLAFAEHETAVIREAHPAAELVAGPAATRARFVEGLSRAGSVAHFAGHSRAVQGDPLASTLRTAGEAFALHQVLAGKFADTLTVLSACETLTPPDAALSAAAVARREPVSFADAFLLGGSHTVLATTIRVDDVSAAMLMKRFYRAAKTLPVPEALQEAQRAVRALDPHPAAWATFGFVSGG